MSDAPMTRLAAKLHRRVSILLTEDDVLAAEALARPKLKADILGQLAPRALLIRPGRVDAVVEELRKLGHTPSVVGRSGG